MVGVAFRPWLPCEEGQGEIRVVCHVTYGFNGYLKILIFNPDSKCASEHDTPAVA